MFLTIEISKLENEYNARCVELDVEVKGPSSELAMEKLKKIINFYIATAKQDEGPGYYMPGCGSKIPNDIIN